MALVSVKNVAAVKNIAEMALVSVKNNVDVGGHEHTICSPGILVRRTISLMARRLQFYVVPRTQYSQLSSP